MDQKNESFPEWIVWPKGVMTPIFSKFKLYHNHTTVVHNLSTLFIEKHHPPGVFCLLLGIFSLMGDHRWSVCGSLLKQTVECTVFFKAIRLLVDVSQTPRVSHHCSRGRVSETDFVFCKDEAFWEVNPKFYNHNFSPTDILRNILLRTVLPSSLFGLFNILLSWGESRKSTFPEWFSAYRMI